MFHSRDSPRLLVCDTGLHLKENDIGFITVAICGGYISKYPRLQLYISAYRYWSLIGLAHVPSPTGEDECPNRLSVCHQMPKRQLTAWVTRFWCRCLDTYPVYNSWCLSQWEHEVCWWEGWENHPECCIDGLVQERCNSSGLATELHLSCTNPSSQWHRDQKKNHVNCTTIWWWEWNQSINSIYLVMEISKIWVHSIMLH